MFPTTTFVYEHRLIRIAGHHENELMFKRIKSRETFYEPDLLEAIRKESQPGVYIDAGAFIGNHSIYFRLFCNATKVIAIEPNLITLPVLRQNLEQNLASSDYMVVPAAVGARDGSGNCCCGGDPNNAGWSVFIKDPLGETPMITIDSIMLDLKLEHKDVAVLKLDIEGGEIDAVIGAHELLENGAPLIAAECHGNSKFVLDELLAKYGYVSRGGRYCASPTYIWKRL